MAALTSGVVAILASIGIDPANPAYLLDGKIVPGPIGHHFTGLTLPTTARDSSLQIIPDFSQLSLPSLEGDAVGYTNDTPDTIALVTGFTLTYRGAANVVADLAEIERGWGLRVKSGQLTRYIPGYSMLRVVGQQQGQAVAAAAALSDLPVRWDDSPAFEFENSGIIALNLRTGDTVQLVATEAIAATIVAANLNLWMHGCLIRASMVPDDVQAALSQSCGTAGKPGEVIAKMMLARTLRGGAKVPNVVSAPR